MKLDAHGTPPHHREAERKREMAIAEPQSGWGRRKEERCLSTGKARTITGMKGRQGDDIYNEIQGTKTWRKRGDQ